MIPHRGGLPHSDTHGSKPARGSPWLFAACHVLHRLLAPRHPPDALLILKLRRRITPTTPMHRNHPTLQGYNPKASNPKTRCPVHTYAQSILLSITQTPLNTAPDRVTARTSAKPKYQQGQTPSHSPARTSLRPRTRKPARPKTPELPCASRDAPEPDSQS